MYDIAENKGLYINEKELSNLLGNVPIIKISAITGSGCDELINKLESIASIKKSGEVEYKKLLKEKFSKLTEKDIEERYGKIDEVLSVCLKQKETNKISITDKLDKIFLNRYLAIPIFVTIMFVMYYCAIEIIGNSTINIINKFNEIIVENIENILLINGANTILISLLTDGIISGVLSVITFLPQLAFLFVYISCLEKVGYMSRISLMFHRAFEKIGIGGSSIVSFILGTGCSVPGIMAAKTIKNENEKKVTAVLTSFVPCSAKLPIISLFSTYFFGEKAGLVAISFYILSIFIIILSSFIFRKINRVPNTTDLISELPEYRFPKLTQIFKDSFERVWDFVKRAGSVIVISSIVVWVLLSFSIDRINSDDSKKTINIKYVTDIEDSILADIGRTFSWIFIPMVGENSWEIAVSSIQGLVAKEQVISSMAIIAGLESENVTNSIFVNGSPFNFFSPIAAYAFVCFNLYSAPCFGAISAMKKILGSNKRLAQALMYQIVLAYIFSCLIFNLGSLIL